MSSARSQRLLHYSRRPRSSRGIPQAPPLPSVSCSLSACPTWMTKATWFALRGGSRRRRSSELPSLSLGKQHAASAAMLLLSCGPAPLAAAATAGRGARAAARLAAPMLLLAALVTGCAPTVVSWPSRVSLLLRTEQPRPRPATPRRLWTRWLRRPRHTPPPRRRFCRLLPVSDLPTP